MILRWVISDPFLIDYELNIDLNMFNIGNGNTNESINQWIY